MFKGTHYAMWNPDPYMPDKLDIHSNILELTIQPLRCGADPSYDPYCDDTERVVINNKRRNGLMIQVHKSVTFLDIEVDSLDSIIRGKQIGLINQMRVSAQKPLKTKVPVSELLSSAARSIQQLEILKRLIPRLPTTALILLRPTLLVQ